MIIMDNSQHHKQQLSGEYVGQYYDSFLSKLGTYHSDHRWFEGPVNLAHYEQTKKTLERGFSKIDLGKVFEVGGGDGIWTMLYVEKCSKIFYLDVSLEMLGQAKKRLAQFENKIEYSQGDFLENNFPDTVCNTFVSIRNFEYFVDKKKFLSEVNRLLIKGGSFLLVTKSLHYNVHTQLKSKVLHSKQISISEVISLLKEEGFDIIDVKPAIFGKLLRLKFMRSLSKQIHSVLLSLPWKILPIRLLGFLSESFYIYAKKK